MLKRNLHFLFRGRGHGWRRPRLVGREPRRLRTAGLTG